MNHPSAPAPADTLTYRLPADLAAPVTATLDDWTKNNKVRRLWDRDASLWTGRDEAKWLGWLNIASEQLAHLGHLTTFGDEVRAAGFTHVLLLGMGGSSLCPEVLTRTFGRQAGAPQLVVLDSTDPEQIRATEGRVDLKRTLMIVSSKSGSTLEPNILKDYFLDRLRQAVGAEAPRHFAAVTDPGSPFEKVARDSGFRWIFHGSPSIGGRYSALSDFGMAPAAAMDLDVGRFLRRAQDMAEACGAAVPPRENPGVLLGVILGASAARGHDKLTLIASPGIGTLGTWLEQLLAESTGKQGKGIIPIDREPLGAPAVYGRDRLFVYLRLTGAADAKQDAAVAALEAAEQPVVRITLTDPYDLAKEFFRWEIATAVAGAVLGINPFDQPDVEASKNATRKLTTEYEATGRLPAETPIWSGAGVQLFTDPRNAAELSADKPNSLEGYLKAYLDRIKAGDYFALLAYVPMNERHEQLLEAARTAVRDAKHVATCLEFGPRFLHSTGQAYKGGPNSGVFLQITCDDAADLAVPGKKYTFGIVKAAQARGDFEVLVERGRRALRVHLGADVTGDLASLCDAIQKAAH